MYIRSHFGSSSLLTISGLVEFLCKPLIRCIWLSHSASSFCFKCSLAKNMAWCCQQHWCNFPRHQEANGYWHRSCCKGCYNRTPHTQECFSQQAAHTAPRYSTRAASRSPRREPPRLSMSPPLRHVSSLPTLAVAVSPWACQPQWPIPQVMLVSIGLVNGRGSGIMASNPVLWEYCIDVRDFLKHNPNRLPYGTDPETQQCIRNTPGFERIFPRALGSVLCQPLVLLACTSGYHRSVALVELVAKYAAYMCDGRLQVRRVHLELDRDAEEWDTFLRTWTPIRHLEGRCR